MQGMWVRSLASEPRFHMPCGPKFKTLNGNHIVTNSIKTLKMIHTKKKSQKKSPFALIYFASSPGGQVEDPEWRHRCGGSNIQSIFIAMHWDNIIKVLMWIWAEKWRGARIKPRGRGEDCKIKMWEEERRTGPKEVGKILCRKQPDCQVEQVL